MQYINNTIQYAVLLQGLVLVQQYLNLGGIPVTAEVVPGSWDGPYRENRARQQQQQQQKWANDIQLQVML